MNCDEAIETLAPEFDAIRKALLDVEWDTETNMSAPLATLDGLRGYVNNLLMELYHEIDDLTGQLEGSQ